MSKYNNNKNIAYAIYILESSLKSDKEVVATCEKDPENHIRTIAYYKGRVDAYEDCLGILNNSLTGATINGILKERFESFLLTAKRWLRWH